MGGERHVVIWYTVLYACSLKINVVTLASSISHIQLMEQCFLLTSWIDSSISACGERWLSGRVVYLWSLILCSFIYFILLYHNQIYKFKHKNVIQII
jgi:hypothetical protein